MRHRSTSAYAHDDRSFGGTVGRWPKISSKSIERILRDRSKDVQVARVYTCTQRRIRSRQRAFRVSHVRKGKGKGSSVPRTRANTAISDEPGRERGHRREDEDVRGIEGKTKLVQFKIVFKKKKDGAGFSEDRERRVATTSTLAPPCTFIATSLLMLPIAMTRYGK